GRDAIREGVSAEGQGRALRSRARIRGPFLPRAGGDAGQSYGRAERRPEGVRRVDLRRRRAAQSTRALVVRRREELFRADGGIALLKIAVLGAAGRMGRAILECMTELDDVKLVGAVTQTG